MGKADLRQDVGLNASNLILANLSRFAESDAVRKFYIQSRIPLISPEVRRLVEHHLSHLQ